MLRLLLEQMRGGKVRYGLRISQYREYVGEIVVYFSCPIKRLTAVNCLKGCDGTLFFATWYEDGEGNITQFEEHGDE